MKRLLLGIGLFLILFGTIIHAHEETTGDPEHDSNLMHAEDTSPSVNQKDVIAWENAAPFILAIFMGLAVFAFAIGLFLHPGKHAP